MEKTLKFNLNESYAEGFNDAREQIIKAIMAEHNLESCTDSRCTQATEKDIVFNCTHEQDAAIAKGVQ